MPRNYAEEIFETEAPPEGSGRDYAEELFNPEPYITKRRQPTGEISAITGKPVEASVEDIEEVPPAFATHIKAGVVDDPRVKMQIYAAARFPNLKEGERLKRYGLYKGEIIYLADDGQLYYETPQVLGPKLLRGIGETIAHGPAIGLGTAGAAVYGERPSAGEVALDIAVEAGLGAAGEIGGRVIAGGIQKGLTRRGGKLATAAGKGRGQLDMPQAKKIQETAERFGIKLTPAQITESPELLNKMSLLADLPKTSNVVRGIKRAQAEQVDDAVYRFLDDLSPPSTQFEAGEKVTGAARQAMEDLQTVRAKEAGPIYTQAYQEGVEVDIKPVLNELDELLKTSPRSTQKTRRLSFARKPNSKSWIM
jgi:hypothetical protein